jgi:hypothetical protein
MKSSPEDRFERQLSSRLVFLPVLLTFALSLLLTACGGHSVSTPSSQPTGTTASKVLSVTAQVLSSATTGSLYSAGLTASGGGLPYSWKISSGRLPDGIEIDSSTGVLSGTTSQTGTFAFQASVIDSRGVDAYGSFSILVLGNTPPTLSITTQTLPSATVESPYSVSLAAIGGAPPYSWNISSGVLPDGFELDRDTGLLSGTTTDTGTFGFRASVTDSQGVEVDASLSILSTANVLLNYYVNSSSGSDSNDGLAPTTGGGHGPWMTISHADAYLVLGPIGTNVNVAAGNYNGDLTTTHTGTSSTPITFISTTPLGAFIVGNGSNQIAWKVAGNYQTISGFDITGTTTDYQGIDLNASYGTASGNRVHDLPGTACPSNGGQGIGDFGSSSSGFSNNSIIGNQIYNIGSSGCNVIHGIYVSNPNDIVENNVVGGIGGGQCITSYHQATNLVISNNTVFNCGHIGILLGNHSGSLSNTTMDNNIVYDAFGIGISCYTGLGSNVNVSNNNVYNSGGIGGAEIANCTLSGNITTDPLFVDYQANGTGNYSLQSVSPALAAGTRSCSSGGISPCTPSTDILGSPRANPPSIGAF